MDLSSEYILKNIPHLDLAQLTSDVNLTLSDSKIHNSVVQVFCLLHTMPFFVSGICLFRQ
jgi:hypothetical protein